ncbi:MAG: thioredoxin [Rhodospirillales bacterium CG15_BIG_FIL_POST_REV_8_21_14_020_66_15]|nr:MAG: thioredoxin [Rhodospirillales bacterium CG15_BIG_FIL_POST_REV_8_21_14_020_66_15]
MAFILNPDGTTTPKPDDGAPGRPQPAGPALQGADGALIKDADIRTFVKDVIEASMQVPVLVDFWASWCGPCKQLTPVLEKLVTQAGGLVKLVKVNADENQDLCAQLRIQSLPTVYAFKGGQPVDAFMGALPESQVKAFIDKLTGGAKAPLDQALEQGQAALAAGENELALQIFREVQAQDPASDAAIAGVLRAQIALGMLAEAEQILTALPANLRVKADVEAAASALELAREVGETGDPADLRARVAADPRDHQARFDLALALFARGDAEGAIDELLELARRDKAWNDEAARKQLVKIFDTLGGAHELTQSGRRRLSSVLFS